MPMYCWKDKKTGKIVEVKRSIQDRSSPPTEEGEWVRIFTSVPITFAEGTMPMKGRMGEAHAKPAHLRK